MINNSSPYAKVIVPQHLMQGGSDLNTLCVSSKDKEAVIQVMDLLRGATDMKPSCTAELHLPPTHRFLTVRLIDKRYSEAIAEYSSSFVDAMAKDMAHKPLHNENDFIYAMCRGGQELASYTPDLLVVKQIVGPLFMFFGAIWGAIKQNSFVQEKRERDQSFHRRKWFKEVLIKETLRKQAAVDLINQRTNKLKEQLNEMNDGLVDDTLVDELKALDKLMCYFSPNTPLLLDNVPLQEYLQQKGID